jgi:hypothetical protein
MQWATAILLSLGCVLVLAAAVVAAVAVAAAVVGAAVGVSSQSSLCLQFKNGAPEIAAPM